MFGCERDSSLCLLIYGRHVPAKLRDVGCHTPCMRQSKVMRQLLRQRQGLLDVCQGLIWVTQEPEGQSGTDLQLSPGSWPMRNTGVWRWSGV